MLARLLKEWETLSNKVRFIQGVISGEIKVSRVKKRDLVDNLKRMGFKTQSQLNEILPEKKRPSVQTEVPEGQEPEIAKEEEEERVAPGEISIKEYDYLLTMQILSLTEERVIELEKQMRDKRAEYELLQKMHIFEIWQNDLANFLDELDKYEEQEEKDRLAHTAAAKGGKGAAKARKPKKKGEDDDDDFDPKVRKQAKVNNENKKPSNQGDTGSDQKKKQTKMADFIMKKEPPKDDTQLTLMERIKKNQAKGGNT